MYTEQEISRILRHWERLQAFRPVLKNNGVRFDCSRMVSEKPVLPWENSEKRDVDYLVSIGNYSVERLMDAIYKKRDRVIPQEEAEMLTDLRSSLCLFRVDAKGKMRRDSFYIIPFMALLGFISKNTSADYSEGEKQILQKNRNFSEEYCKISSLNFEHLEKLDRDVLTSLGFLISDLKNKKNNSTTVYVEEVPYEGAENLHAAVHNKISLSQEESRKDRKERKEKKQSPASEFQKEILPETSFVISDIEKVLKRGDFLPVQQLLNSEKKAKPDLADFIHMNRPFSWPVGKWPGSRPLDFFQQYVVNYALEEPSDSRIRLVNAPAGTDREGIIKAVAAAHIVEKARFLANIEKPDAIFEQVKNAGVSYFLVPEELRKTELIVLTANETKAYGLASYMSHPDGKNMTGLFDAKEKKYGTVNDIYYTRAARNIFQSEENWGLPVLYLGNRNRIMEDTEMLYKDINELHSNFKTKRLLDFFDFIGIRELCEAMFRKKSAEQDWNKIRESFLELYQKLSQLREEAGMQYGAVCSIPELEPDQLRDEMEEHMDRLRQLNERYTGLSDSLTEVELQLDETEEEMDDLFESMSAREQRLYKIVRTSSTNRYNRLMSHAESLKTTIQDKKRQIARIEQLQIQVRDRYERCKELLKEAEEWEEKQRKELEELRRVSRDQAVVLDYKDLTKIYEYMYQEKEALEPEKASVSFAMRDASEMIDQGIDGIPVKSKNIELPEGMTHQAPFMTKEYMELSENLLFLAFQLIKTFVRSSEKAKKNINLLLKIINNGDLNRIPKKVFDHAFATFQILIPVISVPKNAFPELISAAGRNSVGTVIVADAGSWSTQDAFQALTSSRKLILIGDQMSEKVSGVLPYLAEEILLKMASVPEFFERKGISLYDCALGEKKLPDARLMVVHDSDDAIVRFLNRSYQDMLIPQKNGFADRYSLKSCRFMDINGKTADKNTFYVEEQGKVVLSLINNMISVYGMDFFRSPNCDFYIISPYRSVVEGLRNLINTKLISILPAASQLLRNGKLKSLDISNFLYRFKNENIITMEEFDIFGKAKEILLVLGCDRTSYNSVSMVNDVRVLNRMFSGVSGKIAVIGSSVVWSDTMLYKMIQEDFDVVRVK